MKDNGLSVVTNAQLPMQETDDLLNDIARQLGLDFIPCLFSGMAANPPLLAHIWKLVHDTLLVGELHRLTKEMIFVVTANVKRCRYCSNAHLAMATNLGLSPALAKGLGQQLKYIEPEETRDILLFAQSLASSNHNDTETRMRKLRSSGMTEQQIQEIVLSVSVASMMSTLANGMTLNDSVDQEFREILGKDKHAALD